MVSTSVRITVSEVREWVAVEAAWRTLETQTQPSFFQSWTWVGCLADERFPEPILLRAERDGRTVGLALLNRVRGWFGTERLLLNESGNPALDSVYVEHNGVLLARDAADLLPACLHAMLTAPVASDKSPGAWVRGRRLRLSGVDGAHISAARQAGRVRQLRESAAPFVDLASLSPGVNSYLASLSANTRYQIRRSNRRFAELGEFDVRQAESLDEGLAFLNALATLHQAAWRARGLPGAFVNPVFLRFHRALVARGLPRGEVVLLRIASGAQVIGYLYNFRLHGHVVTYQSGFDYPAALALAGPHAKPGLTCHHAAIMRAQVEGAAVYDFLAGPDRYKRSLTREARPLYWFDVVSPHTVSSPPLRVPFAQLALGGQDRQTAPAANVLVLGDDTRAFLATVRSLGRRGVNVHVAPANFRSPALRSRYIVAIHDLPPWMENGAHWFIAIQTLLRSTHFDLVIPCDETTLLPLQRHRAQLAPLARLAIPNDYEISVFFDKHETRELARRTGVSVAPGRLLGPDDTADAVLAEFGAPIVLKPRWSYSLQKLGSRGKVQVVDDPVRLERLLSESVASETILEQFFPGQGVGISLLASRGRVLQAFEHHRVREIAGASFYRISAPLTPDMASACEAIVAAGSYTGVAMFEFKRDMKGEWILLEVNARPWGSMPLPVALGIDFPYRWYRLLTANEETSSVPYRPGIYGRNLFPDLLASIAEAEARQFTWPALTRFVIERGIELLRLFARREVHDVFVWDDPQPALIELAAMTTAARGRIDRMIPGAAGRRQRRARKQAVEALRFPGRDRLVLFVCQGNICRSPFAAALFRSRLGNRSIGAGSAGLMPQPGRSTPDLGLQAAASHGLDLSAHRSVWLTRDMAESATLVIIFDEVNRAAIFDRYPKLQTPVVSLGELAGTGNIADPVDGDLSEFHRVYERIAEGIAVLGSLARGSSHGSKPAFH